MLRSEDPIQDPRDPGFLFGYLWAGQEEIYDGGEGFFRLRTTFHDEWNTDFPEDFSLRTFVQVPEPGAPALLLAAAGPWLWASGRRRRPSRDADAGTRTPRWRSAPPVQD